MKRKVPQYALDPLERVLDYVKESVRLLHMSMRGVSVLCAMPGAIKAIKKARTGSDEDLGQDYEHAKEEAEFARKEREAGFPLFHAHTLVGLWGAFYAAVEDCVVGVICNEPDFLLEPFFSKVKIPLAQFEILERDERIRFLVAEVCRAQSLAASQGVDIFEHLLAKITLSGEVPPITKQLIFEMHNIRNAIVHRAAIADRRLVGGCPWLKLKLGDKVIVKHTQLMRYATAISRYIVVVICRLGPKYGVDMSEFDTLNEDYEDLDTT